MTNSRFHEDQFFSALRDIFVGAEIEGESGFINLMRIKSRYYTEGVFPQLKQDIDVALEPFPQFREELFDKLFTFFQRYFSESGSIYFRYTHLHQNIYEKVYTDDRDVVLFWKTHMLYYVKTDRIFKSLRVEVDGVNFHFDASQIEHKRANEKRDVVFIFREVAPDDALVFDTAYSVRGRVTKIDEILRDLRKVDINLSDETLEKAIRVFEKQSEVDFFINKNARAFLEEQFDLWIYQYLFKDQADVWSVERLAQLQTLKGIAYNVIGFISQFEDELVKIWNKPKFVRNSHYIITLDHFLQPGREELIKKLFEHPGMKKQIEEWVNLGIFPKRITVDEIKRRITTKDLTNELIEPKLLNLPVDTIHFPGFEQQLIKKYINLSAEVNGLLLHSENYQALRTITNLYHQSIKVVYIDPPFNTSASEIIYQNNFKQSSWISQLENRIELAFDLLKHNGIICVAIDDFELTFLKMILSRIFSQENYLATVAVRSNPHGRAMAAGFSQNHEYGIFFQKSNNSEVGRLPRNDGQLSRYPHQDKLGNFTWMNFRTTGANSRRIDRPKLFYPVYVSDEGKIRVVDLSWNEENQAWNPNSPAEESEHVVFPIDSENNERVWNLGWERAKKTAATDLVGRYVNNEWQIYRKYRPNEEGALPNTWWEDAKYSATESGTKIIKDLFNSRELFDYPKSIYLIEDCLRAANLNDDEFVLDFFAGSGTTAHAVMNLNREDGGSRKYILVEMGDHFHDVILPRIKKVAFNSKWKDGKPVFEEGESGISQFVKYYDLEQYEETLQKTQYEDADLFINPDQDPYHSYVFLRDRKLLDTVELDRENDKVIFHPERLYPDIDLAETLSHLRGKWIKCITEDFVEFEDGEQMSLKEPDWETLKPMVWWR